MANVQLNIFENFEKFATVNIADLSGNASLHLFGVQLPGSISFNNIAVLMSASGTTAKTLTISFGLYSLTGSTLSLANSASQTTNPTTNQLSWVTLVTSATQNITPGNWWFAMMSSTSSNSRMSLVVNEGIGANGFSLNGNGGIFVFGVHSVSQTALPLSIATSDLKKMGTANGNALIRHPYILISA